MVIDKTGTLTEGRPRVTAIQPVSPFDENELLRWAGGAEQHSEHPLARAILEAANAHAIKLPSVQEFNAIRGQGVDAVIDGKKVAVGSWEYICSVASAPFDPNTTKPTRGNTGESFVYVAVEQRYVGWISVADPIKASTPEAISSLRDRGISLVVLSGDHPETTKHVAESLGLTNYSGGVKPEQKQDRIRELRRAGSKVAMAGDGINDAPALAEAEVGIAMGTGTDIAMQSAGVTLVHGDLRTLQKALNLGRATMRNIRQNLGFAFLYNLIGVPIAAGALYPISEHLVFSPMFAAAAMSLSSVSVITNALRLRTARI